MTLLELLQLVHKHLKLVIFLPLACAIVAAVASFGFMPDTYTATTSMYVLTKAENAQGSVSNADLSASQMLTNDVASLIKSDRVLKDTAASLNMESLSGYDITVESETTTRVLSVSVEGKDAQSTAIIANGQMCIRDSYYEEHCEGECETCPYYDWCPDDAEEETVEEETPEVADGEGADSDGEPEEEPEVELTDVYKRQRSSS